MAQSCRAGPGAGWESALAPRQCAYEGTVAPSSASQLRASADEGVAREASRSPFRSRRTGISFRNAGTQTVPRPPQKRAEHRAEQATQTRGVSRSQQTHVDVGTEMHRWDTWEEVTAHAQSLMPSEDWQARQQASSHIRAAAAVKIQRLVRCWLARQRLRQLRQRHLSELMLLAECQASEASQAEASARRQAWLASMRRANPQSAADFRLLQADVQAWHLQESQRLDNMNLDDVARRIARQQLCHKETILLQEIDKLRARISPEQHDKMALHNMEMFCAPKQWRLKAANKTVIVETVGTTRHAHIVVVKGTRARSLMEIFQALTASGLDQDVRMAVLLRAKLAATGYDPALTTELIQLVDREAALTLRGRDSDALNGLRKRISTLFLHLLENPKFNPEAHSMKAGQTLHTYLGAERSLKPGVIQS